MSAEFEVHRTFVLENRSLFGVTGVITDGMVHAGMEAELPGGLKAAVHDVEIIDGVGENGASEPVLLFSYSNPTKLQRLRDLSLEGQKLELHW